VTLGAGAIVGVDTGCTVTNVATPPFSTAGDACGGMTGDHVWWQVGSSATIGSTSTVLGSIMATASITTGAGSVTGPLLANVGAVTLGVGAIVGVYTGCVVTTPSPSIAIDDACAVMSYAFIGMDDTGCFVDEQPSQVPTMLPIPIPSKQPIIAPTKQPVPAPTKKPIPAPTMQPYPAPTKQPIPAPTKQPIPVPTKEPIIAPTKQPVHAPTKQPVFEPTRPPTPNGACFHGDGTVLLESGSSKRFSELSIGDVIATSDGQGGFSFSPILKLPHKNNNEPAAFLTLTTETDKKVEMTTDHYIPKCDRVVVTAGELVVGDCLLTTDGKETLMDISSIEKSGVYTAITKDKFIVVNGVIASPYSKNSDPDDPEFDYEKYRLELELSRPRKLRYFSRKASRKKSKMYLRGSR